MRQYLKRVPVYTSVGHLPVDAADQMVAAGRAHSLRGKALLLLDNDALEQALRELDIDGDMIAMILRAAAQVNAKKAEKAAKAAGERP